MPPLTCADQLPNELLLHADIDSQFPDLLLGLGQPPLRGHGSRHLAGLDWDLATTNCYNMPTVRISTLTESGGGRGVAWRGSLSCSLPSLPRGAEMAAAGSSKQTSGPFLSGELPGHTPTL